MISDDIFLGGRDHQEKYLDVGYEFVAHILNSIERLLEIPVEKKNVPLPRMGANIGDGFFNNRVGPDCLDVASTLQIANDSDHELFSGHEYYTRSLISRHHLPLFPHWAN
jgi:hypothetical protein